MVHLPVMIESRFASCEASCMPLPEAVRITSGIPSPFRSATIIAGMYPMLSVFV